MQSLPVTPPARDTTASSAKLADEENVSLPVTPPARDTTRLTLALTVGGKTTEYAVRFIPGKCWQLTRTTKRGPIVHRVALTATGPHCDCPATRFRPGPCKHVRALRRMACSPWKA